MLPGRQAAKAAAIVGGAFLLLALVSLSLNEISFLKLYERRFAFEPGPWFAEHMAPSIGNPNSCIIVGASTAREGFDTQVLGKYLPELTFLNAATTGGNIDVAEIQAQILHRYRVHARCIVIGLHPFLMMAQSPPSLASTGYLSQLRIADVLSLSDHAAVRLEVGQILQTIILPLKTHANRLNKLIRAWTFAVQEKFRTNPLPVNAYEYFRDEFGSGANAYHDGNHSSPDAVAELTQLRYRTYTYDADATEISFKRALALFNTEADVVFLVTMPNQSALRELNAKGKSSYDRAINESAISEIDCSSLVPDAYFIDDVHLDGDGRRILSNAIGRILSKNIAHPPKQIACE